jgi:hypothetical protein
MLKNNFAAGEKLYATDVNDIVNAIIQNEHNIFELYLENYFDSKATPFNGLFFDGFSDTAKRNGASTTLVSQASSGQADLIVSDASEFLEDEEIVIYDATNRENKVIQSISIGGTLATYNESNVDGFTNIWLTRTAEAMSFKPTLSADMSRVKLYLKKTGTPTQNCVVKIYSSGIDPEAGTLLGTSDEVAESAVGTSASLITFDFSTPISLTSGNTYYLVFQQVSGTGDASNYYQVGLDSSSPTYTDGNSWSKESGTWGSESSDLAFYVEADNVITLTANLSNTYAIGSAVKRTTANVDTVNKKLSMQTSGVGNDKENVYYSILIEFQQVMESARLWVTRNWTARFNLASAIAQGATTLTISGDQTTKFANGDTIDIYDANNFNRERKTISGSPSFGGGVTTITFTSAIALATGYGTSAYVERVDVVPTLSAVASGDPESFGTLTYVRSTVDGVNSEVEDEYALTLGIDARDMKAKVTLTRQDATLTPYAKRLGVTFNT